MASLPPSFGYFVAVYILAGLALISLVLRLVARLYVSETSRLYRCPQTFVRTTRDSFVRLPGAFSYDDVCFLVVWPALVILMGVAGPLFWQLEPVTIGKLKLHFVFEAMLPTAITFSRLSILFLYLRMLRDVWPLKGVYILILLSFAWWIGATFGTIARCQPLAMNWETSPGGSCTDPTAFSTGMTTSDFAVNVLTLIFPITTSWKVRANRLQKSFTYGAIFFGAAACCLSFVRFLKGLLLNPYSSSGLYQITFWELMEATTLAIAAALPVIQRLWYSPDIEKHARSRSNELRQSRAFRDSRSSQFLDGPDSFELEWIVRRNNARHSGPYGIVDAYGQTSRSSVSAPDLASIGAQTHKISEKNPREVVKANPSLRPITRAYLSALDGEPRSPMLLSSGLPLRSRQVISYDGSATSCQAVFDDDSLPSAPARVPKAAMPKLFVHEERSSSKSGDTVWPCSSNGFTCTQPTVSTQRADGTVKVVITQPSREQAIATNQRSASESLGRSRLRAPGDPEAGVRANIRLDAASLRTSPGSPGSGYSHVGVAV